MWRWRHKSLIFLSVYSFSPRDTLPKVSEGSIIKLLVIFVNWWWLRRFLSTVVRRLKVPLKSEKKIRLGFVVELSAGSDIRGRGPSKVSLIQESSESSAPEAESFIFRPSTDRQVSSHGLSIRWQALILVVLIAPCSHVASSLGGRVTGLCATL